ncbi:unnamed protein product [Ophioblennius macclurei]
MDELMVLALSQWEYRECSLMCFTETWLHSDIPNDNVTIAGFQTAQADRDCITSSKKKGGRRAVLVNTRWCNPTHITIKERVCCPDTELLAVCPRPYYQPHEFSHTIIVAIYVPPSANPTSAGNTIHSTIARLQTQHPRAFIIISGDFNHITLTSTLTTFTHYVTCPTRENRTLDLLYANIKPLPLLSRSDHNLVHLKSSYVPLVKSQPPTPRTVRRWLEGALETLRGCFEVTDWSALSEPHGDDINSLTNCVTSYINFCVDSTIPTKTVLCYGNNKSWVTKDIKAILNKNKRAFKVGDKEEVKKIQGELKIKIREAKESYRRRLEGKLQKNNMREVWSGMKNITGYGQSTNGSVDGSVDRADELNLFFNRFDTVPPVHAST